MWWIHVVVYNLRVRSGKSSLTRCSIFSATPQLYLPRRQLSQPNIRNILPRNRPHRNPIQTNILSMNLFSIPLRTHSLRPQASPQRLVRIKERRRREKAVFNLHRRPTKPITIQKRPYTFPRHKRPLIALLEQPPRLTHRADPRLLSLAWRECFIVHLVDQSACALVKPEVVGMVVFVG